MEDQKPVLVKKFEAKKDSPLNLKIILAVLLVVVAGVGSGYLLSLKLGGGAGSLKQSQDVGEAEIKKGLEVGISDEKTFKDSTEGDLEKGGADGEGSHHLVRPGGESQNVYLTSSVIDLDKYVGHKVKVWGETFAAQRAGWLMDVGKLKVLE